MSDGNPWEEWGFGGEDGDVSFSGLDKCCSRGELESIKVEVPEKVLMCFASSCFIT